MKLTRRNLFKFFFGTVAAAPVARAVVAPDASAVTLTDLMGGFVERTKNYPPIRSGLGMGDYMATSFEVPQAMRRLPCGISAKGVQ